jgi:hypothetical protein
MRLSDLFDANSSGIGEKPPETSDNSTLRTWSISTCYRRIWNSLDSVGAALICVKW